MKHKFLIFFALIFLGVVLVGLNAMSYVQKEKIPDREISPNRSTYNTGATGTRAFYDLLAESGHKVIRWRDPITRIFETSGQTEFTTFVIIGKIRREFTENEKTHLLDWVSSGGRLIVIDREPGEDLISTTANWTISAEEDKSLEGGEGIFLASVDPANKMQMTADVKAAKPQQPTIFTRAVNAVQPSKFASSIKITRIKYLDSNRKTVSRQSDTESANENSSSKPPPPAKKTSVDRQNDNEVEDGDEENGEIGIVEKPVKTADSETETSEEDSEDWDSSLTAPVVHFANDEKNLLVDFPFGSGQIIFLSDPYIVANGGIRLADNVQIAVNLITSGSGVTAFDEYHQGYGNNENMLLSYFSGTPIVAIFLQLAVVLAFVVFSQSRRFARALPFDEPDRLSKLEYVSAMAQLQERTKGFDLAIENIYKDFRRRVSKLVGVDNHTASREDLANLIDERTEFDAKEVEQIMFECEDIMHGEPTNKKKIVKLTQKLREIEEKLGLGRRKKRI